MIGEEMVVYADHPQSAWWLTRVWPDLVAAAVLLIVVFRSHSAAISWLAILALVVPVADFFIQLVRWRHSFYVLTNRRALRLDGLFRRDCQWLSWKKVTEVSIRRSWIDRKLKIATIEIHTADTHSSFRGMRDVEDPMFFQVLIATYALGGGSGGPGGSPGGDAYDVI
jgi:membrane protein YdbS with pleckstrin-like domain